MNKKILSILLAALLLLGMTTGAVAVVPVPHTHCVCGTGTLEVTGHSHDLMAWKGVSSASDIVAGGSYYLTTNIETDSTITLSSGTTNLCLNGHTLSLASTSTVSVIKISSGATLNLTDCSVTANSQRTSSTEGAGSTSTVGSITGGNAEKGGGVYIYNGVFNMYNGRISGNKANSSISGGGGVYLNSATCSFTMYDGHISENTAEGYGGGVYNYYGNFTMHDGHISGNTAYSGGGVYNNHGNFTMHDGTIGGTADADKNTADTFGGGVYNVQGNFTMHTGNIVGNVLTGTYSSVDNGSGGGVANWGHESQFNMYGGNIKQNTAKFGGGVSNIEAKFTMTNGSISENTVTDGSGGGVYYYKNRNDDPEYDFKISDTPIIQNNTRIISETESLDNVYLFNKGRFYITGELKAGASIGVNTNNPNGDITIGGKTYCERFTSDWADYGVRPSGNNLKLAKFYTITFNTNGGTFVSPPIAGYYKGETTTLPTDITKNGYAFGGWYSSSTFSGSPVTSIPDYAYDPREYYARWTTPCTVSVSASPEEGGTVTGGDTYGQGMNATLTATPKEGYRFVGWYKVGGETRESSNSTYTFSVQDSCNLEARFVPEYTISYYPNGGDVTGGVTKYISSETPVQLPTIVTREGYRFVGWYDNEDCSGTAVTHIPEGASGNKEFYAKWTQKYTVTVTADPSAGGTVSGGGSYDYNAPVTLTATAKTGYTFFNWTENNEEVSTDATYSFTVDGNRNLVANFSLSSYTVSVTANPAEGGTVSGGGTYNHGEQANLTATPKEGYTFTGWTEKDEEVSTNATYTFTVTGNHNLFANFAPKTYIVTLDANGGSVDPTSWTVSHGGTYGNLPTPTRPGYTFVGWFTAETDGTKVESTSTIAQNDNHTLYARWEVGSYTVTVTADPENGGTVTVNPQSAAMGATITITVNPADGNMVKTVTVNANGEAVNVTSGAENTYTFQMPASDVTVNVKFADKNLSISAGGTTHYFESLEEAVAYAEAQNLRDFVIKVEKSYAEEKDTLEVDFSGPITLDLNGKTISFANGAVPGVGYISFGYDCRATLQDSVGGGRLNAMLNFMDSDELIITGGTYLSVLTTPHTKISGGTFVGLNEQEIQDLTQNPNFSYANFAKDCGTWGLTLVGDDRGSGFTSEEGALYNLSDNLAKGYTTDKPVEIKRIDNGAGSAEYIPGFAAGTTIVRIDPRMKTEVELDYSKVQIPDDMPETLNTEEEIRAALKAKLAEHGLVDPSTLLCDATLMYSDNGGLSWVKASEEHFPAGGGLTVTMPVPKGTHPDKHVYTVVHMFTTDAFGKKPGEMEVPDVSIIYDEKGNPMLSFEVTGLSPIMIAWTEKPSGDELPQTGDNSSMALWVMLMGLAGAGMYLLRKRAYN